MASKKALRGLFVVLGVCMFVMGIIGIFREPDGRKKIAIEGVVIIGNISIDFMMDSVSDSMTHPFRVGMKN